VYCKVDLVEQRFRDRSGTVEPCEFRRTSTST